MQYIADYENFGKNYSFSKIKAWEENNTFSVIAKIRLVIHIYIYIYIIYIYIYFQNTYKKKQRFVATSLVFLLFKSHQK